MNNRQRKALAQVFANPVPKTMAWAGIEALFMALGAERVNRGGSIVTFFLNGERGDFYRPHPAKGRLLELAGVTP